MKCLFGYSLIFLTLLSCADVTKSGKKVRLIEIEGDLLEGMNLADRISAKFNCQNLGIITSDTSLFPPVYSLHENEVHAALRNRGAKIGSNIVIANFYKKPAKGVTLKCDERSINELEFDEDI